MWIESRIRAGQKEEQKQDVEENVTYVLVCGETEALMKVKWRNYMEKNVIFIEA